MEFAKHRDLPRRSRRAATRLGTREYNSIQIYFTESLFSVDHVYRTGCHVTFRIHSTLAIAKFDTLFSYNNYVLLLRAKPLSSAVLTATPVKAVKNGFTRVMNIINSMLLLFFLFCRVGLHTMDTCEAKSS